MWFDAEDVTPPIAGYWRTARATSAALAALTTKVQLSPTPKRWILQALLSRLPRALRKALVIGDPAHWRRRAGLSLGWCRTVPDQPKPDPTRPAPCAVATTSS